jgi:hypothetical protein
MNPKFATTVALICLVGIFLIGQLYLWRDNDEAAIDRNLARIVELAEKNADEAPFFTLSQSREILQFISQNPTFEFGPPLPSLTDRQELGAAIAQVRQTMQTLSIRITDRTITFSEDRESAEMEVEAEATVTYSGESGRDRRRFAVTWVKEDDNWVIHHVRLLDHEQMPAFDLPL